MLIPDNEEIIYRGSNELKKNKFYMQGFLISLIPAGFISCLYIFLKALNPITYFIFVFIFYIILSIYTSNKTYKYYLQFFGSDEIAISKTKIYYNVCMNNSGVNENLDSNKYLKDITEVYIRNGWNPKTLVIYFSDGTHIAVHSLKDIDTVLDMLKK